jgi:F-type H+-transporting ATPase subunit a
MRGLFLIEAPPVSHVTQSIPFCGSAWFCQVSGDSLISSAIAIALTVAVVLYIASRVSSGVPGWLQLGLETLYGFVRGQQMTIDEDAAIIVPLGMTIFLYILIANWIDFLPLPAPIHPANSDLNQTLAMGVLVFVVTQWYSFKVLGVGGYVRRMTRPFDLPWFARAIFVPLNIIEDLAKPLTLSLRLFGNIFGGLLMVWVLTSLLTQVTVPGAGQVPAQIVSVVLTVVWKLFDVGLIGAIQALIFMLLTIIYFEQAREGADHGHGGHGGAQQTHSPSPGAQPRVAVEGGNAR